MFEFLRLLLRLGGKMGWSLCSGCVMFLKGIATDCCVFAREFLNIIDSTWCAVVFFHSYKPTGSTKTLY